MQEPSADPRSDVTQSLNGIGAITLFVDDLDRSKAWYQDVFDRPVVYEDDASVVIKFDNTIVNLLMMPAAHELIAPAAVADRGTGSRFQLTIWVDDADAACAALHQRGVVLVNGPMDREWKQRTACFADPDGHIWEIAQTLS
jgi:catechol 2,3-dioxygenase-like lactoylglutathione lyase family enzyme